MKRYLHALAMCQSMFCAIPCPWNVWDEDAREIMLLPLPLVGLEMGLIWAALAFVVARLGLPTPIGALLLSAYPYVVTGYLHLDGFMDVTDAVRSCRSLERRREILKDSHVGSFAVIALCLLVLTQFSLFASAGEGDGRILIFLPAVSRSCSALAVTGLKPLQTSQYAGQARKKSHLAILGGMLVIFLGAGFLLCGIYGLVLLGCLAGYAVALRRGYKALEGMNGDIAGYALTIGELCGAAVYALI